MITADRLNNIQEYYFSKKLREVRGLMAEGRPIINMGIGSPDLAPSPQVLETLRDSIIEAGAHQYQSYQGLPELRTAIADFYLQKFDVSVDSNSEILPLMGSKEGIMHISMAFLNEGDEVLLPNPGYPTYASVTNLVGGVPVTYDLKAENGWFPDLEELSKKDLSKVKLMWISYPHMPTGATATKEQLKSLVNFAKENEILLVNDNPYSFVLSTNPTSILSIQGAKDCTLELNSLSKTFNMAGWRVGMVLGSAEHINAVLKVKSNMDSGMFYGIQKGAVAALKSGPEWFEALDKVYKTRRELMFQLADKLGCTYDKNAVGMFVWCKLPNGAAPSEEFIDNVLYDKDIFIAPGTIFGSNGEGYIRFSLCVSEEKIKEAIERF
ncbi:MAG: aminotransferase class I/II-fold pyridoxal phosphate-dependent enzyme [Bacteroidota bacterium]|uniref:Aminotransferase n=1 Tax=Flagellimonas okinawensis TaxID=3031324 RepID=A0ABT5XQF4_9FLAO|nr:aminotransferase class I/II-fold pyridoxal phosphate-dependent enzyme [[Muricauda] okinawensis]MDF0708035.1 aminotransferase class I/II-fold pyridoxal phosphate-dependent enzyme [[Muricauda] okinawensis]MEC8831367.1 aminotransferase class I/II-fold pyridoxal phosphate-dependent enzyme [Bacteroidota bacterium]